MPTTILPKVSSFLDINSFSAQLILSRNLATVMFTLVYVSLSNFIVRRLEAAILALH